MPNGKAHAFVTIAATLATPLIVHGLRVGATPANATAAAAGCLLGLFLTPDLDVNHGCSSMQTIRRRIGKWAAELWRAIWMPYAVLIPHRSWLSHLPIAGTAFRLGYLYLVYFCASILIAAAGLASMPEIHLSADILKNSNVVWAFAGLSLADSLHFAMDAVLRQG